MTLKKFDAGVATVCNIHCKNTWFIVMPEHLTLLSLIFFLKNYTVIYNKVPKCGSRNMEGILYLQAKRRHIPITVNHSDIVIVAAIKNVSKNRLLARFLMFCFVVVLFLFLFVCLFFQTFFFFGGFKGECYFAYNVKRIMAKSQGTGRGQNEFLAYNESV